MQVFLSLPVEPTYGCLKKRFNYIADFFSVLFDFFDSFRIDRFRDLVFFQCAFLLTFFNGCDFCDFSFLFGVFHF